MTDYLFAIIDEGTALLGNGTLCTVLKEKNTFIKMFGTMYIDFYQYPPYSGVISEIFETILNAHIQCDHGYPYS